MSFTGEDSIVLHPRSRENGEGLTTDVNTHAVHMKGQENGLLYFCLVCNTKFPTIPVIYNLDVLDGKIS